MPIPEKRAAYKIKHDTTKEAKKKELEELSHEHHAPRIRDRYGMAASSAPAGDVAMSVVICDGHNNDTSCKSYSHVLLPQLEEPAIEAMGEPSLEEMSTLDV